MLERETGENQTADVCLQQNNDQGNGVFRPQEMLKERLIDVEMNGFVMECLHTPQKQ